jgi:4-amino-4-deoxy-L-arabinose transferase-like glycosyltransferase
MVFSGDVAWFYLDARDLLLGKAFPLVGITSSHNWMHQGAYWTYLLSLALFLGKFNPLAGGYLAAVIGVVTVYSMYVVGKKLFSEKVGLLAALFYTLSPFAIFNMRLPLDTTPLPLLSLGFLYFLYEWVKGKRFAFVCLGILFALLYNFELASIMFIVPGGIVFLYGYVKRTPYFLSTVNRKTVGLLFVGMTLIMLPMLIYDIHHGFPQTIRFAIWLIYRLLVTVGIIHLTSTVAKESFGHFFQFILSNNARIMFLLPPLLAIGVSLVTCITLGLKAIQVKTAPYVLLALITFTTIGVFIVYKTPSEAYLPLFIAYLFLALAVGLTSLSSRGLRLGLITAVLIAGMLGTQQLIMQNYQYSQSEAYAFSYDTRLDAVKTIIQKTAKSTYTIEGKNMFIKTPSFTMNYEYLLWYLGHPVVEAFPEKIITIEEAPDRINIGEK